jgi:ATP/maltotriose-dependent transcriptional regulator MalT/DNA-binding SARP family transcriptional activator
VRPVAAAVIPRPRLFGALDRAPDTAWLCGPPGSGKTALASSYVEARRRPSAWYQIDAGDGDLATFFDSMSLVAPAGRRACLPAFTSAFAAGAATFTRRFFQSFFDRCPRPFLLVLDDYDLLPPWAPLHEMVAELVAAVPPGCRVIVISRDEPPPSLSRVRSAGALGIVGGADLRLTTAEIRLLARRRLADRGAGADVETIARRSQGWAAGAALLLDARGENTGALANAPTAAEAPFDYFAGAVLAKLTPPETEALLAMALLPNATDATAVEVSGQPWAPRLLERLSRRQCFIERREAEETVYRFHPMFHEFLKARAMTALALEERRRILSSGANHLAEAGQIDEAACLLVEAQEWKALERLILDHAAQLLRAGRGAVVLGWIDALPAEITRGSAWLAYWLGVSGHARGFAFARESLGRAALAFEAAGESVALASALAAMFETFFLEGDSYIAIDPWIDMALALVDAGPADVDPGFAIATFRALFLRRPDDPHVPVLRDRLLRVRGEADVVEHAIAAGLALAYYYAWMGEPVTAAALGRTARERTGATPDVVTLQTADYIEGVVAITLGDGDLCETAIQRGLERAEITGMHALDFRLQTVGVYAARMHRDPGRVARRLAWMRHRLDAAGRIDRSDYHMLVGWDLAVRGDVDRAYREVRTALALAEETGIPTIIALPTFLLAQLASERGDAAEAEERIARTRVMSEGMGSESMLFMTEMVEADLAVARGDRDEGLRLLRHGLERARRQRLRFYAGWRPSVMTRLCTTALEADICVEYVQGLVRHHALVPDRAPVDVPNWPWAVEVRTLGGLRLRCDGQDLRATARAPQRPLDLLRALIAFGGRHVPTAKLTDALWPESEGDSGQQALDTNLLRLRRLLGSPDAIIVEDGRVSLDEAQCVTDVWQLERRLDRTEAALQRRDGAAELDGLGHDIVRLYAGPFLAETDQPWAVAPRERLRRRVVHAFEGIGRLRERRGDAEGALAACLRGLDVDELAEGLYQRAMRCYGVLGRQAEGIALYQQCRRILGAQLGVEPSPDTRAILTTLTAGRSAADLIAPSLHHR